MPEPSTVCRVPARSPHSHLFTVRLWREDLGEGRCEWRGKVEHVLSGEARTFRDWAALIAALLEMLETGQDLAIGETAAYTRQEEGAASTTRDPGSGA